MDCTVATHKQAVQEQPPAGYEFQNVVLGVTCTPICSMFSEPAGGSQTLLQRIKALHSKIISATLVRFLQAVCSLFREQISR